MIARVPRFARLPLRREEGAAIAKAIRLLLRDTRNWIQAQLATRVPGHYCPSLFAHYGVNSTCNLRCSYCFIREPETFPKGFSEPGLPLEQAKRVLEHAREEAMFLRFMGGEPLIYPHFIELVRYAKRHLLFRNVSVITNGLPFLRKSEQWRAEALGLLDAVTISIDATRIKEYPGEMAALTDFLPTLKSLCGRHHTALTMNYAATWDELATPERIDEFVSRYRGWFSFVYIVPVRVVGRTPLPLLRNAQALMRKYSLGYYAGPDYPEAENLAWYQRHCNPKLKVKIMADGGLLAPCENHSTTLGSLVTQRIRDLWKGPLTEFPNLSCIGCGKQRFRLHAFKSVDRQIAFLWTRPELLGKERPDAGATMNPTGHPRRAGPPEVTEANRASS